MGMMTLGKYTCGVGVNKAYQQDACRDALAMPCWLVRTLLFCFGSSLRLNTLTWEPPDFEKDGSPGISCCHNPAHPKPTVLTCEKDEQSFLQSVMA